MLTYTVMETRPFDPGFEPEVVECCATRAEALRLAKAANLRLAEESDPRRHVVVETESLLPPTREAVRDFIAEVVGDDPAAYAIDGIVGDLRRGWFREEDDRPALLSLIFSLREDAVCEQCGGDASPSRGPDCDCPVPMP